MKTSPKCAVLHAEFLSSVNLAFSLNHFAFSSFAKLKCKKIVVQLLGIEQFLNDNKMIPHVFSVALVCKEELNLLLKVSDF